MVKLQLQKPFISIEITKLKEGYIIRTFKKRWLIWMQETNEIAIEDFPSLERKIQQLIIQWNIGEIKK